MAGPVGHIVCALALLNSDLSTIKNKDAFFAGTLYPDSRYVTGVRRADTHKNEGEGLNGVLKAGSDFEAGRLFHVFVDKEREKYMREHDAYRFVKGSPFKTQMLKIIEDHFLFDKLKGNFNASEAFGKIYDEEHAYAAKEASIKVWHNFLLVYLNQSYWLSFSRYYNSLLVLKDMSSKKIRLFDSFWQSIKTVAFLVHAYIQLEILSRNEELKAIILGFYETKMDALLKEYKKNVEQKTVDLHALDPPSFASISP